MKGIELLSSSLTEKWIKLPELCSQWIFMGILEMTETPPEAEDGDTLQ